MNSIRREEPHRRFPPLLFILLIICAGIGCRRGPVDAQSGETIALTCADGYVAEAVLAGDPATAESSIVLVHGKGQSRSDWETFATAARAEGFATIAVDLRDPNVRADDPPGFSPWLRAGYEIEAARSELIARGASLGRIGIAGAGIGGSLALHFAAQEDDVAAIVLISPGLEDEGIATRDAMANYAGPVMFVSGAEDAYSSSSARTLHDIAPGLAELREYPGGAFGTNLVAQSANARSQIFLWLKIAMGIEREVPDPEDQPPE